MYNRILVAVDGSDTSHLALQEAVKLAKDRSKDQRPTICLFHVVDLSTIYSSAQGDHVAEYQDALQTEGQRLIADASAIVSAAGIQSESKCIPAAHKPVYDLIEEAAKEWPADLIVVGTHGRRGFRRLVLGSVAEALIRITSKPVLLIRRE